MIFKDSFDDMTSEERRRSITKNNGLELIDFWLLASGAFSPQKSVKDLIVRIQRYLKNIFEISPATAYSYLVNLSKMPVKSFSKFGPFSRRSFSETPLTLAAESNTIRTLVFFVSDKKG